MAHVKHDEVEAKFAILDATLVDVLRSASTLESCCELHAVQRVHHRDVYMDTPACDLLRTRYALRIRRSSSGASVTVKSLPSAQGEHIHRRVEIEEALALDIDLQAVAQWPSAISNFLLKHLGAVFELQPLCAIYQIRDKRLVSMRGQDQPTPFAELSIDEVRVFDAGQAKAVLAGSANLDTLPPLAIFWETEAELLAGGVEANLDKFVQELARQPGLRPLARSKFERAMEVASQWTNRERPIG